MIGPTAITIGNFDGVHLGHAALVRTARQTVEGAPFGRVVVLTFDPHPMTVLRPGLSLPRLSTFDQRREWLKAVGADEVHPLVPTTELLSQSPREFVQSLIERFNAKFFVEGDDFHFGKDRAGSIATLRELEGEFGHRTIVVPPVEAALVDQSIVRVSSSLIRWLLLHGRVRDAGVLLGRPYEMRCEVVKGDQRGRTIGFPTANLASGDMYLPADGIYFGRATVHGSGHNHSARFFPAAISVGTKPTFGEHPRTCEAHLMGFDGRLDDYGWTIHLEFHDWLRDQLKYQGVNALIEQLHRDVQRTEVLMRKPVPDPAIPCSATALATA